MSSDPGPVRRRTVTAPPPSDPRLPCVVINVECAQDEDVEWVWTATAQGRFVSGYRLVSRKAGSPC